MKITRLKFLISLGLAAFLFTATGAKSEIQQPTSPPSLPAHSELESEATIHAPRSTTCLELMSGCGSVRIRDQSILLQPIQTTHELDGSTTISGNAHWINRNEFSESSAPFVITLPRQLNTVGKLQKPELKSEPNGQSTPMKSTLQCSRNSQDLSLQDQVLAQVAEVMMGQEAISRRAALFTPTCVD